MKNQFKTLLTLMLLCMTFTLYAQQKPPYERTRTNQVLSDYATWSKYFLGIPRGATPSFPAYVPDSAKCGALYYRTTDSSLYVYNCEAGTWERNRQQAAKAYADSLKHQLVTGDNIYSGTNTYTKQLNDSAGIKVGVTSLTKNYVTLGQNASIFGNGPLEFSVDSSGTSRETFLLGNGESTAVGAFNNFLRDALTIGPFINDYGDLATLELRGGYGFITSQLTASQIAALQVTSFRGSSPLGRLVYQTDGMPGLYEHLSGGDSRLATSTDIGAKADTVSAVLQRGDKTNLYEKTKAAAPTIRNIYIKPFLSNTLHIGFNYDDGYTTEYTLQRNDDSLLLVTGANVGATVPYTNLQVSLFGTFITASTNSYTITPGDTFTFTFNGNGFSLNTFKSNVGGVWDFYIPAVSKHVQVSMYNSTTLSSVIVPIASGLPENTYTVVATFIGADPLNPPSGGVAARGWFKYSATTPQTINYTSLTGVMSGANVSMLSPGAVIETALSIRKTGGVGTDTLFKFFPEHSSITGTTRNLKIRLNVDERILTRPDSVTTLITGIKKIVITQEGDGYYPTGTTKLFSFAWTHTFDNGQLSLGTYISSKNDSLQMASSYVNLLAASLPTFTKLEVGDTSYTLPSGITQTVHFGKPSGNILFKGTVSGNNYAIAQASNLLTAFDYPRQKYTDTSMFMQINPTVAKVYYNVSPFLPAYRVFKTGMAISDFRQLYIVKTPSTIQEPQIAAGVPITQPNAGGTGTNKAPTSGQILVGQASGIFTPKPLSGLITIDSAGAVHGAILANYGHAIFVPTTGTTVTLQALSRNIINAAGTLAALTFVMPTSPANGDVLAIKFINAVTAITWPSSVKGGGTSAAAASEKWLQYDSTSGFWY